MFLSLSASILSARPVVLLPTFTLVCTAYLHQDAFTGFSSNPPIAVTGGSNFGPHVTSENLRASRCTSGPIVEDKSNYWTPTLYFQWANGSFASVDGTVSVKYLFNPGEATPFPEDFRMLAGNPALRSKSESKRTSDETFLCLNPLAQASRNDALPPLRCPGGLRSQVVRPPLPHSLPPTGSHPIDVPKLLGWKSWYPCDDL